MFSHDTLIKCKGKCLAFFYEGGRGASPKAVCRSPKDFRPSKMLAHSNRKIILVIYQVSQEKKYTKLIKRNLKVDIKHLTLFKPGFFWLSTTGGVDSTPPPENNVTVELGQ